MTLVHESHVNANPRGRRASEQQLLSVSDAHLVEVRVWRHSVSQRELPRRVNPRHTRHIRDSGNCDILAVTALKQVAHAANPCAGCRSLIRALPATRIALEHHTQNMA